MAVRAMLSRQPKAIDNVPARLDVALAYERLRGQAFDAEERADEALVPHLARLMVRTNNRKRNSRKGKRSFWNETKSTLPAKIGGTEITRFNARRHGPAARGIAG
jgi:hypothetical protein